MPVQCCPQPLFCILKRVSEEEDWLIIMVVVRQNPHRSIGTLRGALVRIVEASWRIYKDKTGHMQLLVGCFEYLGGEGCPTHGEPTQLYMVPTICELLKRRLAEGEEGSLETLIGNAPVGVCQLVIRR